MIGRRMPRRIGVPLAGLALLAGIAVLAVRSAPARAWMFSATGEENAWEGVKGTIRLAWLELTGPELALEPDSPIDHLGGSPYGVNTFLQLEADPAMVRLSFETMRDAGIGWARQHFPWEDIEIHGRGDFEDRRHEPYRSAWDKYDRIVTLAHDYNVELLVRLDDPPDWAYAESSAGPVLHKGPPDDLQDYGRFVAAVGERYCGLVRYYQLWNEPNIFPEWGEADVDPAGYAELLEVGAEALRAACPSAVVVSAALAQTTEPGGRNMDDLAYLRALYEAGWQDDFDVLAVQAFGLWTGPTDRRVHDRLTNFNRLLLARDIMVRAGDGHKAVWITEMGWNSAPDDIEAVYGRVSEEGRARYTRLAYERIAREWPFVGPAFLWFLRRPNEEWHSRPEGWFRIVEPNWDTTPTYGAMRDLGTRTPIMHRGRHEVGDRAIAYFGPWRDVPAPPALAASRIGSASAELNIVFEGTGYRLLLAPSSGAEGESGDAIDAELGTASDAEQAVDPESEADPEVESTSETGPESEADPAVESTSDAVPTSETDPSSDPTSDADPAIESTSEAGPSSDTTSDARATGAAGTSARAEPARELFVVLDGTSETLTLDPDETSIEVDGLDDGTHTLIVRVDAGELALDEVVIEAPDPVSPLRPLWWTLAGIAATAGATALFVARRRLGRRRTEEGGSGDGHAMRSGGGDSAVGTAMSSEADDALGDDATPDADAGSAGDTGTSSDAGVPSDTAAAPTDGS